MRLPRKVDYAVRVTVELAAMPPGATVPAALLAGRLGLPVRFVEQQAGLLARAGVLVSRRGARGGCALARPAGELTVADVVRAVDGEPLRVPEEGVSPTGEYWTHIAAAFEAMLEATTVEELAHRRRDRFASVYDI
jgi:Rrf2 family protein